MTIDRETLEKLVKGAWTVCVGGTLTAEEAVAPLVAHALSDLNPKHLREALVKIGEDEMSEEAKRE